MGLSCDCGDFDGEFFWRTQNQEGLTLQTKRRQRCRSCGKLIDIGAEVVRFDRFRYAITDVEAEIRGEDEEIEIASWYMCFECGGFYVQLADLGFCLYIGDNMAKEMEDYREKF